MMGSYGRAEGEDWKNPSNLCNSVADMMRAFDPNVILVIGYLAAAPASLNAFQAVG
jgi:hypothetical protein